MPPAGESLTMRCVIACVLLLTCSSTAGAQNTFISGSLVAEIARFNYIELDRERYPYIYPDDFSRSLNDEVIGFGIAIERSLSERWGVMLEFIKPGTMSREERFELPVSIAVFPPLPPLRIEQQVEQKRMSWNTMALVSQDLGDRVELAFLGGVSFTRSELRLEYDFTVPALVLLPPDIVEPSQRSISYSVDPIVGVDARVRLSGNFSVVPGLRVQSAGLAGRAGWLLRPSVGVRWGF